MGKKAFHMSGGLQLLFGIKGKRWDRANYGHEYGIPELFVEPYCNLYNQYWIKPLKINTPDKASNIDGATYW